MLDQEFADKLENAKEAFKINAKNGKIAVQKKTKKSAYKVKVTVNAAGNDHYHQLLHSAELELLSWTVVVGR